MPSKKEEDLKPVVWLVWLDAVDAHRPNNLDSTEGS